MSFYIFEKILQFFLVFLLFQPDNFIVTHLKNTYTVWVLFLYNFEPKVSVYSDWSEEIFPLKIS